MKQHRDRWQGKVIQSQRECRSKQKQATASEKQAHSKDITKKKDIHLFQESLI